MIDINEYNRRDIIASCLLEAVDIMKEQEEYDNELLYEDADKLISIVKKTRGARPEGKKLIKELDKLDVNLYEYYNGLLTKDEGKQVYNTYIDKMDLYIEKIKNLPDDTFIDRMHNRRDTSRNLGTNKTEININGEITGGKSYTAYERAQIDKARKDTKFTKTKALSKVRILKTKIENAYKKYYA